jgi:hypothetical protein
MTIPFIGGPVHAMRFEMTWIPPVNIMISERDKMIYAYVRDETAYFYDAELSAKLTARYDEFRKDFEGKINKLIPVD